MGTVYPKALYGCEVTKVPTKQSGSLATSIVNMFMPRHASRRSPDIFWVVAMDGLRHPMTQIHIRRIEAVRVTLETGSAENIAMMERVHATYKRYAYEGDTPPEDQGPVAMLWMSIRDLGAQWKEGWVLSCQ